MSCDWIGEVSSHASFYVCWGSRVLRFTWHSLRAENVFTLNGNLHRRVDTPSVSYFCLTKGHALLGSWIHPCCDNLVLQPPPPPPQSWWLLHGPKYFASDIYWFIGLGLNGGSSHFVVEKIKRVVTHSTCMDWAGKRYFIRRKYTKNRSRRGKHQNLSEHSGKTKRIGFMMDLTFVFCYISRPPLQQRQE